MRTPWHLWVIGIVSLLWNAGGAYDYLMTQLNNEAYLSMLTDPQRAMMDSRPAWFDGFWAVGVWFSVLGSLLLLLRSRFAAPAFGLSILGLAGSSVWSFAIATPNAVEIMGTFAAVFSAVVAISLLVFYVYARAMHARGHLK